MLAPAAGGRARAILSSGREFLAAYRPEQAGCLVLDVRMPGMNGLEVQRALWERGAGLPIIFITAHGDVPTCARAFRRGVRFPGETGGRRRAAGPYSARPSPATRNSDGRDRPGSSPPA